MELMGNAFLTCMIMKAERVNHSRYSMLKLLGIKAASVNFVGINWPGMTIHCRHQLIEDLAAVQLHQYPKPYGRASQVTAEGAGCAGRGDPALIFRFRNHIIRKLFAGISERLSIMHISFFELLFNERFYRYNGYREYI
jgi:hypothetical protein